MSHHAEAAREYAESLPLVEVEWRDHCSQKIVDDYNPPWDDYRVVSVGYVIRENEIWLSIAQDVSPFENEFHHVDHIMKVGIIRRTNLRTKKRRKRA